MTDKIITKPSTPEYEEAWNRVFGRPEGEAFGFTFDEAKSMRRYKDIEFCEELKQKFPLATH